MSGVWSERARADGGRYRSDLDGHADVNGSEQWHYHERSTMAATAGNMEKASAVDAPRGGDDISVTQKMISATWGSLLTSLLGTYTAACDYTCTSWGDTNELMQSLPWTSSASVSNPSLR